MGIGSRHGGAAEHMALEALQLLKERLTVGDLVICGRLGRGIEERVVDRVHLLQESSVGECLITGSCEGGAVCFTRIQPLGRYRAVRQCETPQPIDGRHGIFPLGRVSTAGWEKHIGDGGNAVRN